MDIIDMHAHVFPPAVAKKAVDNLGSYYNYTMHGTGTFEDLTKSAKQAGVGRLVICSTATRPDQVENINTYLSGLITDHVAAFGSLHRDYENFEAEIDRMEHLGLKGVKLHPDFQEFDMDDKKMFPIYEALEGRLPILFHVGDETSDRSAPKRLARVLENFPKLTAIGAHLGGYSRWDEAMEFLIGKNLYIDTSSVFRRLRKEQVTEIIKKHGVDKVLFGTDYPLERHDYPLENILALRLSDDEKEQILYTNAYNLIFR